MSEPKFTPGPWRLDADSHIRATNDDRHKTIALIPPDFHSADIWDANAHLIAAAPELYKALEGMVIGSKLRLMLSDKDILPESPLGIAVAALAKARGEG